MMSNGFTCFNPTIFLNKACSKCNLNRLITTLPLNTLMPAGAQKMTLFWFVTKLLQYLFYSPSVFLPQKGTERGEGES